MVPKPAPALLSERGASAPDRRRLALLALGHAVTDSYGASFLSPIFPLLAARLGLNMAMGGSLAMSAFTVGGNIGFGLAPLVAAFALRTLGLGRLYWVSLPGLLLGLVMWRVVSQDETGRSGVQAFRRSGGPAQPGKHLNTR